MNKVLQANEELRVCGIKWVRDIGLTLLVNDQNGKTFILRGLEATIWDWLALNLPYGKIARLLAAILDSPVGEAEIRLNTILHRWVKNQLLVIDENAIHD